MAGMKNDDAGLIDDSTGMINQETELINGNTGMTNEGSGLIIEDAGMITYNDSTENTVDGRKKRSRERGKDSKPRNFPLHTLKNLPQFRDKSHEEVRRYILEKKGVDTGSNFNVGRVALWILLGLVIVVGGIGLARWLQQRQEKNDEYIVDTNSINY